MNEPLPPHVARLVRDKTLQSSAKLFTTAMDYAGQRLSREFARGVPPHKLVPTIARVSHEELRSHGVGLGYMVTRHPRYRKRVFALVGGWVGFTAPHSLELLAEYRVLSRQGNQPYFTVRVSKHALERVSERRGTILPADVRAELAPAVNGLLLASAQAKHPKAGAELVLPTANGVAIAHWGDARQYRPDRQRLPVPTITTWMGWDTIPGRSPLRTLRWDYYEDTPLPLVSGEFVGATPALPLYRPRGEQPCPEEQEDRQHND